MEIKGVAVKSIPEFVKSKFPDRYDEWLESLPLESRKLFQGPIFPSQWYPLEQAAILPTEHVGKIFYNNDTRQGAWQSGRHSADAALSGIYRFFVKASSPGFIIGRAGKIFSTYYQPSKMEVPNKDSKSVILQITEFEKPSPLIENRIGGWVERALEISGCSDVSVNITKSLTRGAPITEYSIKWS